MTLLLPGDYTPAWGQSCSDVLGPGQGDRWCALWCLAWLVYVSTDSGQPEGFVRHAPCPLSAPYTMVSPHAQNASDGSVLCPLAGLTSDMSV